MADLPLPGCGSPPESAQADFPPSQGRLPVGTAECGENEPEYLYSVRMRAAGPDGRHVSGAERIVSEAEVPQVSSELLARALDRGGVAEAHVSVDRRERSCVSDVPCLSVTSLASPPPPFDSARLATYLCGLAGVSIDALEGALAGLHGGFYPETGPLRGAVLLDAGSGARLDLNLPRGVRARHFDYSPKGRRSVEDALRHAGLTHFRTREALALASKVIASGVALELCWSDDPDYRTGYIATPRHGYVRIPDFKLPGSVGGRVFFLPPNADVQRCIQRLEDEWVLVQPPVHVRTVKMNDFLEELRLSSNE